MTITTIERTFVNGAVRLVCEPYSLNLRSAFGTSHSSTTVRTNALISIHLPHKQLVGWGEVGLPPKKKDCYLADYNDIAHFFHMYCDHLASVLQSFTSLDDKRLQVCEHNDDLLAGYDAFSDFPAPFFNQLRTNEGTEATVLDILPTLLLKVLDTCEYVDQESGKPLEYRLAGQCGVEMAIFDLWGSILGKPLYNLIGIDRPVNKVAFYTVGMNDDPVEYAKSVEFGLKYTKHLKLKLDGDIRKSIQICQTVHRMYSASQLPLCSWSVDANSAWTPESTLQFLDELEQYPEIKSFMYMIEQPFPVDFLSQIDQNAELGIMWTKVKHEAGKRGIFIFADESVSTAKNMDRIKDYVHGVNFKLEKAGGIRGVLNGISTAKKHDLKIWLGCMVSSRLSCTCSAHLLSLSEIGGDLDGDLLVKEESQGFHGGFTWCTDSYEKLGLADLKDNRQQGIGLVRKLVTPTEKKEYFIQITEVSLKTRVLRSEGIWMVAFVAPWCGHCQRLHPEYDKAAESLGGVVNIGRVNCDDEKDLAMRYGIKGFPTIKIFNAGKEYKQSPDDYQSARSASAIVGTLLSKFNSLPDPVQKLDSVDKFTSFVEDESKKVARAILVSSKDSNPNLFKSIAIELRTNDNVKLGFIPNSALSAIVEKFDNLSGLKAPALLLYTQDSSIPIRYEGKMKKDGMLSFISSLVPGTEANKEKQRAEKKAEEERKKNEVKIENIESEEKLQEYCEKMCVFTIVGDDENKKQLFTDLAQQYKKHETLKFAFVNANNVPSVKTAFGLDLEDKEGSVPIVVLRAGKKKYASKSDVNKDNAEWFFEQILYGGLKFNSIDALPDLTRSSHDEL